MDDHRVIKGQIHRVVQLEAADVRDNTKHVMNEPPLSPQEQRAYRAELEVADYEAVTS